MIGTGATFREGSTAWQRWLEHPQSALLRKIGFQIHLWVGIGIGLYVTVISLSGSAIVFRRELLRNLHQTVIVADAGRPRMGLEETQERVRQAYPGYELLSVGDPEQKDQADIVVLERHNKRLIRLSDPYSGADLGARRSEVDHVFGWLADLHDNLLTGLIGRTLNGVGAFLVMVVSSTGAVVWWPGIRNWRRSLTINRNARFARLTWDVHSAVGFWSFVFVLIWGISGICLCFPGTLDFLLVPEVRFWMTRLHFGRFNKISEAIWTILGLVPAVLACTGALMWWNRVLSKAVRHARIKKMNTA